MNGWKRHLIALALPLVAWIVVSPAESKAGDSERFLIHLSIRQGDPHGSREAGTLTVVAEPTLLTYLGQEAAYFSGGEVQVGDEFVEFGYKLQVTPEAADGFFRLTLTLEHTELLDACEEATRLRIDRARYSKTIEPREVLKLDWGKPSERMWIELRVEELGE